MAVAAPTPLIAYKHDKRLSLFVHWIEDRIDSGIWFHPNTTPVHITQFGYGISAVSDKLIAAGQLLAQVPKRWILSPRNVSSPELAEILASDEYKEDLTPTMKLTIAYIYESCKGEQSPWYGYLTSLNIPDVPFFWDADEVELLKGTHAHEEHLLNYVFPSRCVLLTCKGLTIDLYKNSIQLFFEKHRHLFDPAISEVDVGVWTIASIIVQSHCFRVRFLRQFNLHRRSTITMNSLSFLLPTCTSPPY